MRTIELSASVSKEIEMLAAEAGLDVPPRAVGARLAPALPDEVHDALIGFRQGRDSGALLIHGVGPGPVPDSAETYIDLPVAAPLLLGLVSLIATPVAARDEWDGAPLTDIKVTPGLENTVSSKGKGGLPLHQESQHLQHPPDGLALLTVRGGSPTRLAATPDIVEAVAAADPEMVDSLRRPLFRHRLPDSYEGQGAGEAISVLLGDDAMPELNVDLATTEALDGEGEAALAALAEATKAVATDLALVPGTLLVFDNRRWLHGRGSVIAASPDRWLLRSLFVFDSWRTQGAPGRSGEAELLVFA
jgi:Taurine catabolism dioxygenase TauD, TfdA family